MSSESLISADALGDEAETGTYHDMEEGTGAGLRQRDTENKHGGYHARVHHHSPSEVRLMESYEALDYDIVENDLYRRRRMAANKTDLRAQWVANWGVYFIVGVSTGFLAFLISEGVEGLLDLKFDTTLDLVEKGEMAAAFIVFLLWSVGFCLIAACLVTFVETVAGGSGIPELKGYLNGTNYLRVLRFKTLVVKAVGVVFSVSGGLAIGKEGPLVHSGAALAANVSHCAHLPEYLKNRKLKRFRNDHDKRDFVSGGAAAGVAAAFGAPIGGVLFSLEEASSFWSLPLTWRVFFAAMCSTFTLNFFKSLAAGDSNLDNAGLITFGGFKDTPYRIWEVPVFMGIGVIGGVLGALFNAINMYVCKLRRDVIHKRAMQRVLEVLLVALVTATFQFWAPTVVSHCTDIGNTTTSDDLTNPVRYRCDEGQFNDMATLIFTPLEKSIKGEFHNKTPLNVGALLVYLCLIFVLAVWTYGISVPSGLFVPCILVGSAYGRAIGELLTHVYDAHPGTYALIGATSMLGGVTRMTISLTVILLETTTDIQFLLPIMLVLMVSKWVGDVFNISLYDMHVEIKCMPFVEATPPRGLQHACARDVMTKKVVMFPERVRVRDAIDALLSCTHNGFPVARNIPPAGTASALHDASQQTAMFSYYDDLPDDYYKATQTTTVLEGRPEGDRVGVSDLMSSGAALSATEGASSGAAAAGGGGGGGGESKSAEGEGTRKHCVGMILRNQILTLLQHKVLYPADGPMPTGLSDPLQRVTEEDFSTSLSSRIDRVEDIHMSEEEMDMLLNLHPVMNPAPFVVQENWPLSRVYRLYRSMGIRHLPVVNLRNEIVGILSRKELQTDFTVDLS